MADRRFAIGPVKQNAADNFDARSQRDRIGRIPRGGIHGAENIVSRSDHADIDRIAGNAVRRARYHGEIGKRLLMLVVPPRQRQHDVGQQEIEADDRSRGRDDKGSPFDVMGAQLHGWRLFSSRTRLRHLRLSSRTPGCRHRQRWNRPRDAGSVWSILAGQDERINSGAVKSCAKLRKAYTVLPLRHRRLSNCQSPCRGNSNRGF